MSYMNAALLYGKRDIRIEKVKRPTARPDEVVVQIKAVGICGSDIHYYQDFSMGKTYQMKAPQILGHEPSGIVVEVGENVKGLQIGDRVTIEPGETCGHCRFCKSGHYNLCKDVRFLSVPGNKGAFAEYVAMRSDMVFKIPDQLSYEIACLAEPLSVGLHACKLAEVKPGERIMILGGGPIGLMAAAAALAFGITDITLGDIQENRLEFAKEHCHVEKVINTRNLTAEEILKAVAEGEGFDCVIETSGASAADYMTVDLVRKGGRISLIGIPREEAVPFHIFDIIDKEITLKGVFRYTNCYPLAIQILKSNVIDFGAMITNRFSLEDTGEALEYALTHKQNSIKTVVVNENDVYV